MVGIRRRFIRGLCFLAVVCVVQWNGGLLYAAKSGAVTDAKAYLAEVNAAMASVESYHSTMAIDARSLMAAVNITGVGDFLLKPQLTYRNTLDCVASGIGDKQTKFSMAQYISQTGDQITAYSEVNGTWSKRALPMAEISTPNDINTYMRMIKSVKIKDQTATEIVLDVTVDNKAMEELLQRMFKQGTTPQQREQLEQVKRIFSNVGDFTYLINIDKKTKYVMNVYMDLSEVIKASLYAMIDSLQAEGDKEKLRPLVDDFQMILQVDNSAFNQVKPFKIPRKVVKTAVGIGQKLPANSIGIIAGHNPEKR